jgi:hypothetical protein
MSRVHHGSRIDDRQGGCYLPIPLRARFWPSLLGPGVPHLGRASPSPHCCSPRRVLPILPVYSVTDHPGCSRQARGSAVDLRALGLSATYGAALGARVFRFEARPPQGARCGRRGTVCERECGPWRQTRRPTASDGSGRMASCHGSAVSRSGSVTAPECRAMVVITPSRRKMSNMKSRSAAALCGSIWAVCGSGKVRGSPAASGDKSGPGVTAAARRHTDAVTGRASPQAPADEAARGHGHVAAGSTLMILDSGCSGIRGRRYGLSDALWQE